MGRRWTYREEKGGVKSGGLGFCWGRGSGVLVYVRVGVWHVLGTRRFLMIGNWEYACGESLVYLHYWS